MGPLLVEVRKELDSAMLIIEHDMPLIMGMSDRVYCLEPGRVISAGDPSTVRDDPEVIASYLGMDERTIHRSDSKVPGRKHRLTTSGALLDVGVTVRRTRTMRIRRRMPMRTVRSSGR